MFLRQVRGLMAEQVAKLGRKIGKTVAEVGMDSDRNYFPWGSFQLWLREGIRAGVLLNKIMVASWPKEQRPHGISPISHPEEIELMKNVLEWLWASGRTSGPILKLTQLKPGSEYPPLNDEDARTLWLGLSEYGTLSERYKELYPRLRTYIASFGNDIDKALQNGMDGLWRSFGPALDPERSNIEKAA